MSETTEASAPQKPDSKLEMFLAFAKAQAAFEVPKKTKHYLIQNKPVKYADLADVIEAVRKPLGDNGFSVTHRIGYCKGPFGLSTILMHSSGNSLETWYPLPDIQKQSIRPQDFGGQLTYARRYSLSALLGVASDEDTDAEGSPDMTKQKPAEKPAETKRAPTPAIRPAHVQQMGKVYDIEPQSFPPEDVPVHVPMAAAAQATIANDPGLYVMPMGETNVKGAKLSDLPVDTVKSIQSWATKELAKTPKVKNLAQVFEIHSYAKAYLERLEKAGLL